MSKTVIQITEITGLISKKVVFQIISGGKNLMNIPDKEHVIMDYSSFLKLINPGTILTFDIISKKAIAAVFRMRPVK